MYVNVVSDWMSLKKLAFLYSEGDRVHLNLNSQVKKQRAFWDLVLASSRALSVKCHSVRIREDSCTKSCQENWTRRRQEEFTHCCWRRKPLSEMEMRSRVKAWVWFVISVCDSRPKKETLNTLIKKLWCAEQLRDGDHMIIKSYTSPTPAPLLDTRSSPSSLLIFLSFVPTLCHTSAPAHCLV